MKKKSTNILSNKSAAAIKAELAKYSDYMNVATELLDNMVAQGFGENFVVHLGDTSWTYKEMLDRANRVAEVLVEDCGLLPGNRVLLRAPNTPMLVAAWFGVLKAGGICVTTMPMLRARELRVSIDRAHVSIALSDITLSDELQDALDSTSSIKHTLYFTNVGNNHKEATLEKLCSTKTGIFENVKTAADDIALIAFTSGTTGKPKGAMHFHRDIFEVMRSGAFYFNFFLHAYIY